MTAEEAIAKTSAELKKRIKDSPSLQKLLRRINSGKATFADTAEYSNQVALMVGDVLSDCVRDPQTAKFSGRVAEALLKEQYEEINSVMQTVQTALDKQRGLHIAPQKAALPLDRIKAAAYSLVDMKATAEQLIRRAESAPVTVVRSYHDQYIHENAMFRSSAGLRCFLVRTTDGKCCEWCSQKAGRYEYGEHPEDIFRRHDNCGCTVTYENGRQRQNVWSKEKWEVPEAGAGAPRPTVLNYAQGKELQAKNMQYRGLTTDSESGKIESIGIVEDRKLTEFFLKQDAKHSAEFFDVGYTSDNPEKLKADFLSALAKGERRDLQQTEHGERFSILSELGVTKKKQFRTVWQKDTPDSLPRIITGHREDDD